MADLDFDFFGAQLQARIVVPKEGGAAVTAPFDPPSDPNAPDFIRFVYKTLEQITVDEEMGTIGTIEVTFTPTYEIALDMLKSKYIKVGNILYIRWGYSKSGGQLSPWKSGLIVSPPRVQLGPITRITIVANAWGHQMARISRVALANEGSLTGTYQEVFHKITTAWGFKPANVDDSQATEFYKKNTITPFNLAVQSDYDILRRVANDSGNDFIISGPTIRVVSMKDKFSHHKPKITWTLYGQINPTNLDFPMYDFEFQADALFLPQFQKGVVSDAVNNDAPKNSNTTTKQQTPTGAGMKAGARGDNGAELTSDVVGGGTGPSQRANNGQGGQATQKPLVRQNESDPSIRQARHAQPGVNDDNKATRSDEVDAQASLQGAFIKVNFNAIGVPFMEPSELVNLRGVGIFDGIYYLTSVSHTIGRGGYDITCEAINQTSSNALKVLVPPDRNAGPVVQVGAKPEQPTNQPAGAGSTP